MAGPPRDPWWFRFAVWLSPPSGRGGFSLFAFLVWGSAVITTIAAVGSIVVAWLSGTPEHRQSAWATATAALALVALYVMLTAVRRRK